MQDEQKQELFESIYFGKIGMCGCGNPEEVQKFIYELLNNHKEYKDEKITYEIMSENRQKIIKQVDANVIFEFVFHILEHNDLIEHGSSVYSSWLTEKGNIFLELLAEVVKSNESII